MYKYEFLIIIFNMRSCLQQPYPFQHTPLPVSPPLTPTPQNLPLILFLNYANHTDHNVIIFDGPTPLAPPLPVQPSIHHPLPPLQVRSP